ncbi:MAG: hypothetical protein GC164_02220 [Phycisphaera sp.]|nr:hypothetical protein [Phycisphaera sp.]
MRRPPKKNSFRWFYLHVVEDRRQYTHRWWKHPGFIGTLCYRVKCLVAHGAWYWHILLPIELALRFLSALVAKCELPAGARVGPGLFLPHPNGVILSDTTRVGPRVAIYQQVTLAWWRNKSPMVHARASIFAGAKVLGDVHIGRRAFVGANAVVTHDVPEWHTAAGMPARCWPRGDIHAPRPVNCATQPSSDHDPQASPTHTIAARHNGHNLHPVQAKPMRDDTQVALNQTQPLKLSHSYND